MLKHLEHLSKEVEQLLETLKSKQKGSVIEIRNTEVENLFKQGKFIRFNYGAMYIPRVTITEENLQKLRRFKDNFKKDYQKCKRSR